MENLAYRDINEKVLRALSPPGQKLYYIALLVCFLGICLGAACWGYQIKVGVGAAGMNHPVMWGTYLINFVFWIEVGHAGSLMSALLYILRASWRSPIARSAEAMTIFSVAIAGLFPFIHLGRVWFVYWLFPYPNERNLWPNFQSPLIFDFWAASGYLTLSIIFWFTGLIPDFAAARDASTGFRRKLYKVLSFGWTNSDRQWRPYSHAYILFAGIVTAFVPCVASIVSWDYALTIVPGYHSTIYGPYFIVGAVLSGLALLLTLMIPMRRIFGLEEIVTISVLENVAKIIVLTALLMGYVYVVEQFLGWYSGTPWERTTFGLRTTGYYAPLFWATVFSALIVPLLYSFKRIRTSTTWLFVISIIINIGMWLERFVIIIGPPSHDFVPYAWGTYWPSWVEWCILAGSVSLFFFLFLIYAKLVPVISLNEVKEDVTPPLRKPREAH